jgi:hypothetical protein
MIVVPTTKAMTAPVNTADPSRFRDRAGSPSRPAGTELAMTAASTPASGR